MGPADGRQPIQDNRLVCGVLDVIARNQSSHRFNVDIVKVRLQTTSQYKSALDGATQIFKNEGPLAFYKVPNLNRTQDLKFLLTILKGTLTPLVGIGACVSLSLADS